MNKRQLINLSLTLSFLGMLLVWLGSMTYTPPTVEIGKISTSNLGDYVKVCGTASNINQRDTFTSFILESNQQSIKSIAFKDLDLEQGQAYCINGRVDLYKGELEIVADKVKTERG